MIPDFGYAQHVASIGISQEDIVLNPYVYIFKDKTAGIDDIEKVISVADSAFQKNTYFQEVHYGFSRPSGWCRFTITNTTVRTDWVIKIHQARVDTVLLYVQRQNGALVKYPMTGHFQPLRERVVRSLNFVYPVSIEKDETIVCYLFTMRKFARHAAIVSLQTADYNRDYDTRFIILMSSLMGVCVLAILIGIVMFLVLYERVYLSYSVYCLSFVFLVAIDSGFFYGFISAPSIQKTINNFSIVAFYWLIGWHLLFTIELLKINKYKQPWIYWLGTGTGIVFCSVAFVLVLPVPDSTRRIISQVSYYALFVADVYVLYVMIIHLIRKEVAIYFYMAGFLFTVFAASISRLADLQVIEGVNHRTDIMFIAPVIEIVCMVIGLGINSSRYVKERMKAQRQIITVQEDERKRIAQDLHDEVGNSLAAIKNMLVQRRDPLVVEKEIDLIIQGVRNISHDLMPVDFKEHALTDIVRQTVNKFKDHPTIQFEYNLTGTPVKLHPVAELVIYRILNELITNSIKHSQATHVMIQLIYQDRSLMVMVEDNGTGLNQEAAGEKGIGLKNIQHRVKYINANLVVESDSKGTLFIIEVPFEKHLIKVQAPNENG
jgi:signal transduction histidine kinase